MSADEYFTPAQIAKRLQITERTIYRWLDDKQLKGVKLGRVWRVKAKDLEDFLRERENVQND